MGFGMRVHGRFFEKTMVFASTLHPSRRICRDVPGDLVSPERKKGVFAGRETRMYAEAENQKFHIALDLHLAIRMPWGMSKMINPSGFRLFRRAQKNPTRLNPCDGLKRKLLPCVLGVCAVLTGTAFGGDSSRFHPGKHWLDNNAAHINAHGGGVLFHKNTYYWFGEHKIKGRVGNRAMVGVHVYSSKDLYNWRDEGIALKVSDDPESEIQKGCIIERPKVIFNSKTKKFVMWFHLEFKGTGYRTARTGVAVSDMATGPYRYLRSYEPNGGKWPLNMPEKYRSIKLPGEYKNRAPISRKIRDRKQVREDLINGLYIIRDFSGAMARDMTLFVDDDGKAYHIHSSEENITLHISELTDDYTDFTGKYVRVLPYRSNEAPAVFKRKGKYYLLSSGCSSWNPNAARSAVADSIFGPWKELANPAVGTNPQNGLGPEKTFGAQSTFVLPVRGKKDAYIAMFDIWCPSNAIDGRYVWLPITFTKEGYKIKWRDEWDLSVFDKP